MTILSYLRLARALFHSRMMEREEKGIGATGAPLVLGCGPGLISCRTPVAADSPAAGRSDDMRRSPEVWQRK